MWRSPSSIWIGRQKKVTARVTWRKKRIRWCFYETDLGRQALAEPHVWSILLFHEDITSSGHRDFKESMLILREGVIMDCKLDVYGLFCSKQERTIQFSLAKHQQTKLRQWHQEVIMCLQKRATSSQGSWWLLLKARRRSLLKMCHAVLTLHQK